MGSAVAVTRGELTAAQLRSAACASEEPAQVRRLLAIALVLEGVPRQQAAAQCGMDRQTLRDWVHRYNEGGVAGLHSRACPGRAPLLTPKQKAELKALVVAPCVTGVVARLGPRNEGARGIESGTIRTSIQGSHCRTAAAAGERSG